MLNQKEIADNLKIHRKRLGLTQEQLGEKVGITAVHYGHIERCESGITLELLIRLAEVFKVGLNDLLGSNVPSCIRVDVDQRLVDLLERATVDEKEMCLAIFEVIINRREIRE